MAKRALTRNIVAAWEPKGSPSMIVSTMAVIATCALQGSYAPLWITKEGGTSFDLLYAAAADSEQGIYVVGTTRGEFPGPQLDLKDWILRRVDRSGQTLWAIQAGTVGSDSMRSVAADDAGNVFIGGSTFLFGSPLSSNALIVRVDSLGSIDWQIELATSGPEVVTAIIPDGSGGCIAIGQTFGDFGGPNAGRTDVFATRINAAGVQTSAAQIGTALSDGNPKAVGDGAGGYFVSFITRGDYAAPNAGGYDAVLARFDAADSQLWARQYGSTEDESTWDLANDGAGGVFVAGTTTGSLAGPNLGFKDLVIGRFDGAGNELFLNQEGDDAYNNGNAVDWDPATNRVFVAGTHARDSILEVESDGFLRVYTADGVLLQENTFGGLGTDAVQDVVSNGLGGALVAGYTEGLFGGPLVGPIDIYVARFEEVVGTAVCSPAVPNSTGIPSEIRALGNPSESNGNLSLQVTGLPNQVVGYFLASLTQAFVPMAGGSMGTLCLGGSVGRYVGNGQVQGPAFTGTFLLELDLSQMPTPLGLVPVTAGQAWTFQAWHRDTVAGGPVTNFSDAVAVTFQ